MSERINWLLDAFDGDQPLERAKTIPSEWYRDPAMFEAERRFVFSGSWQAVAHTASRPIGSPQSCGEGQGLGASLLSDSKYDSNSSGGLSFAPGAFVTAHVAGEPVVVIRDEQGKLHALSNVCRHRGAKVLTEPSGITTKLRCHYHGWTYDLAGNLKGTPEFDGVEDFHKADCGLPRWSVDTWGPLVFVRDGLGLSLADHLFPLCDQVAKLGIDRLRFVERREYELNCNWKVFVDNYLDGGYHVNTIHPDLAGVIDYSQYRTEIFNWTSVQSSPLVSNASTTASVRSGERAWYWWVFPNLVLNIYDGVMDTNLVLPLGPDRCKVIFDFYFTNTESAEDKAFIAKSIEVTDQIQQEDMGVCEEVAAGLRSRGYDTGRFSVRREIAGYHFHRLLAATLRDGVASIS